MRVLSFLDREGPSTKKIIEYGEANDLDFVADSETDSLQGKYRWFDSHVVEGLKESRHCSD